MIHPPLLSLTVGRTALYLCDMSFLGTEPTLSHWCWTMWKTPISTADKSCRAAGVKPGSVDIPGCLMAPNELNSVVVTSGWQSGCWYQIEVVTSHFPRTFPLYSGYVSFEMVPVQWAITMESFWLTRVISGGFLVIVNLAKKVHLKHNSVCLVVKKSGKWPRHGFRWRYMVL